MLPYLLFAFMMPSAQALEPFGKLLRCTSDFKIAVIGRNEKPKFFEPGTNAFDPEEFHRLDVIDQEAVVAQIYPLDGIHSSSSNTAVEIKTDKVNYITVKFKSHKKLLKLSCQF